MRAFALVANSTSFTIAAQRMGRSSRLASKYVADLENAFGVQLLNRTTRSVSLIDAGERALLDEPRQDQHIWRQLDPQKSVPSLMTSRNL